MELCPQSNVSALYYPQFVITFPPRSKCLNFKAAVTIFSDFGAQENKVCHCLHCFLIYLPWSDGTGCHDLSCLNIKPTFSLFFFTFIKRLFSFSSLSAIRVVSSVFLRLFMFLLAILIPVCASSSPAFLMMYSAYKLINQGDTIQPWWTFPDLEPVCCSMSSFNCCFLTCMQISQEAGQVVWYSHLEEFSTVCCDPHSQRIWHSQ